MNQTGLKTPLRGRGFQFFTDSARALNQAKLGASLFSVNSRLASLWALMR